MAITPTTLIRHIKANLGATVRPLPISDEEIMEVIKEETLPTFSNYYPYYYKVTIYPGSDFLRSSEHSSTYVINTNGLEITGISRVYRDGSIYSTDRYPYYASNNVFDIAVSNNYSSDVSVPDTFKFHPPALVELFPKYNTTKEFLVECKCVHPDSLVTIPISLKDPFFELSDIDIAIKLFPILKMYDQINTPYGNIDLKINDLEDAKSQRKELLETFKSNFMKEPGRRKIWIK